MDNETTGDSNSNVTNSANIGKQQFTLRSILIVTLITAVASVGAGLLWQAMNGKLLDIGPFVMVTSMAPLGLMIIINWLFRIFGKL